MSEAIFIFGAGNIGRSFVGQIFGRAGYEVIFADLDTELVSALNRDGHYTVVHRHPDGRDEELTVPHVRAIDARNVEAVIEGASRSRVLATSVGANALPHILPRIADAAIRRAQRGAEPFDIILAENIHGAGEQTREHLRAALGASGINLTHALPGVVECSVGKMVPLVSEEIRQAHPTTVWAEAYNTLIVDADGFRGALPAVPELMPVRPIAAWVERKLYIHNLGHAATAYIASEARPDVSFISDAIKDPQIRVAVDSVMHSAATALHSEHPGAFALDALSEHIDDLLNRFASPTLGDTIFRVGRDVPRKLGPSDRIMGAWHLMRRHSVDTSGLEEVMRAACRFSVTDEHGVLFPADRAFKAALAADPLDTLCNVCGLNLTNPDHRALIERIAPETR